MAILSSLLKSKWFSATFHVTHSNGIPHILFSCSSETSRRKNVSNIIIILIVEEVSFWLFCFHEGIQYFVALNQCGFNYNTCSITSNSGHTRTQAGVVFISIYYIMKTEWRIVYHVVLSRMKCTHTKKKTY